MYILYKKVVYKIRITLGTYNVHKGGFQNKEVYEL